MRSAESDGGLVTRFDGRFRVLVLMAADAVCLFSVWTFTVWAYRALGPGHYKYGAEFYLRLWPVVLVYIALNAMFRLYHGSVMHPAAPVTPPEELRRAQPFRDFARRAAFVLGFARIPVILAGEGDLVRRLERSLSADSYLGFRVVRTLGADIAEIAAAAKETGVKTLVSCLDPRVLRCQMPELVHLFSHIEYMPSGSSFPVSGGQIVSFDGLGGIEMVNQRHFRALRMEKQILDRVLALVAFIVLSPFFVVVPILVKLTSRGPVFYRQDRLGKRGRPIRVWKFRSMYADADERLKAILESDPARRAEWDASFKLRDDPRVTPLGRFLRKTSIDEFPQLFNVFAGDMALVGPRPIVEKEVHYYGSSYETFASVKPGITGLWQASGRSDTDYPRRVALDVHYVLNWSPWMDIWILFRTVYAVVFMRGAR